MFFLNLATYILNVITSPIGYLVLIYFIREVNIIVSYINSLLLTYFFMKFAITDDERYVKVGLLTFIQLYGGYTYQMSKLYYFYNYFMITVFASQFIIYLQTISTSQYDKLKLKKLGEKVNQQIVVLTFLPLIIEGVLRIIY